MEPIEAFLHLPLPVARPLVALSYAQSLDGSLAAEPGRPLLISGPQSLRVTHHLRAAVDALLVGIGTVLADNPRLTARLEQPVTQQPRPVVLDSRLRTPPQAALFAHPGGGPWLAAATPADPARRRALEARGAEVLELPGEPVGGVNLPALLDCLAGRGVRRLMVEGGPRVIGAFLAGGLADWAMITIAPRWVGGVPVTAPGAGPLVPAVRLADPGWMRAGQDWIVWGRIEREES